jgi:hypothetical protein
MSCSATLQAGRRGHHLEETWFSLPIRAVARLAQVKNPEASAIKREAEESGVSDELGTRIGRSVLEKRLGTRRRRHEGSPGSASISDW